MEILIKQKLIQQYEVVVAGHRKLMSDSYLLVSLCEISSNAARNTCLRSRHALLLFLDAFG